MLVPGVSVYIACSHDSGADVSCFIRRVLQQFCSCRSAGGSTPSSLQALSRVRSLEPWQPPPPCTSAATALCWITVSPYCIFGLNNSPFSYQLMKSIAKIVLHNRHSTISPFFPLNLVLVRNLTLFCCVCLGSPVPKHHVLPKGRSAFCLQGVPERQNQDQSPAQSSSSSTGEASVHSSSEQNHLTADCSVSDQQRALLNQDSPTPGLFCALS